MGRRGQRGGKILLHRFGGSGVLTGFHDERRLKGLLIGQTGVGGLFAGHPSRHGAPDQVVQFPLVLRLGGGRLGFQAKLKAGFLRLRRGLRGRRGGRALFMAELFQRVQAKGPAGTNLNFLQRVMFHGILQRALGGVHAKVHVKVRPGPGGGDGRGHRRLPCRSARRAAPGCLLLLQIRFHVKGTVVGLARLGRRVRQRSGQVFQRFLLGLRPKEGRVVGGFLLLTGSLFLPESLDIIGDELDHVHRGDGKKHHQARKNDENHDNVGPRTAKNRQQGTTHRHAQDTAGPEFALSPGKEHLDGLEQVLPHPEIRKDHRHTAQKHRHQGHFAHKFSHPVARGQQIRKVKQERPHQTGEDAEHAEQPSAQRVPEALPRNQHQRNEKQSQARQHHAAGQILLLRPALFPAGNLFAVFGARPRGAFLGGRCTSGAFAVLRCGGTVCGFS